MYGVQKGTQKWLTETLSLKNQIIRGSLDLNRLENILQYVDQKYHLDPEETFLLCQATQVYFDMLMMLDTIQPKYAMFRKFVGLNLKRQFRENDYLFAIIEPTKCCLFRDYFLLCTTLSFESCVGQTWQPCRMDLNRKGYVQLSYPYNPMSRSVKYFVFDEEEMQHLYDELSCLAKTPIDIMTSKSVESMATIWDGLKISGKEAKAIFDDVIDKYRTDIKPLLSR